MFTGLPPNVLDSLAAMAPFSRRPGRSEEYAEAVEFLDTNGYINDGSIRLDGELRMAPR